MKDFINKLYKNHSLIYKVLLFISTTFLIVYLFPKSGKFKYNFEKGKPWQSESLQAPFDFAIKKTDEEIASEKKRIDENAMLYFDLDNTIEEKVNDAYNKQFKSVFSDTLSTYTSNKLFNSGKSIVSELYKYGVLTEDYNFPKDRSIIILDGREKKLDGFYSNLIQQNGKSQKNSREKCHLHISKKRLSQTGIDEALRSARLHRLRQSGCQNHCSFQQLRNIWRARSDPRVRNRSAKPDQPLRHEQTHVRANAERHRAANGDVLRHLAVFQRGRRRCQRSST